MAQVKVIETKETDPQGFAGIVTTLVRVRLLAENESVPEGSEVLPDTDQTPVHDWQFKEGVK